MTDSLGRHATHSVSEDTLAHHRVLLTVVQFCGGGFLWLVLSRIPHDYRTFRRRRPGWTLLILYVLCQYVALVSVLLEIVYVCTYPRPFSMPFGNAALGLRRLALMSGFGIMLLRVNSLWDHAFVSSLTTLTLLAFAGVIGLQLSELELAYIGNKQDSFVSLLLYASTLVFVLGVLGVLHVRKRSTNTTDTDIDAAPIPAPAGKNTRPRYNVPDPLMETWSFTFHWLCSVVAATVYFAYQNLDPHYRRAIGFAGCLVGVLTASWEYDKLVKDNVEVFFTPLKFLKAWWRRVRSESEQPGTASRQRLRASIQSTRSDSPSQLDADDGSSRDVFALKALSTDGLERRKSLRDGGLETVTEEGTSSVLSSPALAFPPDVQMDGRVPMEEGEG